MNASSHASTFASLFPGLKFAWGALHGECVKEALTLGHYERHLAGKVSLGIYPMQQDSRCHWAAIDVDEGQDPTSAILVIDALNAYGLHPGVYLERSKGKGWHPLILFDDWVPARDIRRILKQAIADAGLDHRTECFPKQDTFPPNGYGNYINLPYFGGDHPEGRRMVHDLETPTPIPLEQWLITVQRFPAKALDAVLGNLPPEPQSSTSNGQKSSTQLEELFIGKIAEGFRRGGGGLPSVTSVLRSRGIPEGAAVALLVPWAREHLVPPLPDAEVEGHVRSMYQRYGTPTTQRQAPVVPGQWVRRL